MMTLQLELVFLLDILTFWERIAPISTIEFGYAILTGLTGEFKETAKPCQVRVGQLFNFPASKMVCQIL